jgi:hypothetical protein
MYGLAYVLIPPRFDSLQVELDRTLAPFRRGGEDEFPREKLAFEDATDALTRLHRGTFRYNPNGSFSLLDGEVGDSFELSLSNLQEHLAACALDRFEGSFAEIEPDFDRFVRRFTYYEAPDPVTRRYGRWLNPIGYWDWWELGGRFNGVITGERRPAAAEQAISSGPSRGRMVLGNVTAALGAPANAERAQIEANVELVETLMAAAGRDEDRGLPTALVLPVGSCADADRWFDRIGWHEIRPGTRGMLGAPVDADFADLARRAYHAFADHAAAGVAYHF